MMFAARGMALSFAVFVLLYAVLSVLAAWGGQAAKRVCSRFSPSLAANLLFGLRILPIVLSGLVTFGLMVPSFLLLEPHSIDEPIGAIPLGLGLCGLILLTVGVVKATAAQVTTSRVVAAWLRQGSAIDPAGAVPLFSSSRAIPALTVAGILKPRVLLSETAAAVLTRSELRTALKHEMAHVSRRDNFKKLLFSLCVFPRMVGLERAWLEAAEMAADDAAVSNASEALDLASALIKLSCIAPLQSPSFTTALLPNSTAEICARVERLVAWEEERTSTDRFHLWYALVPGLGTIVYVALSYHALLIQLHRATEWLMR
jgi:Zn-dependent protease with chaperone function